MKNLPIGVQTLPKMRERNCVYVDKTELVHQLVTRGTTYFFSRPRRFGKSLLVSTLKELYQGNKALFEGLWIYDKWDWSKTNPVLHFSFDSVSYEALGMTESLKSELVDLADSFNITLVKNDVKGLFKELIQKLSAKHGKVVILIDEYDKPIIDYLEKDVVEQAKINRNVLREFYSILKNAEDYLEFVFITGISKFAKVSLFSHLNNLEDITINKKYATLTGYTHQELEFYFKDYLKIIEANLDISYETLLNQMSVWYNGYSWDGIHKVYNPFGTLNFLSNEQFKNFWFSTGSPNFLIHQMRKYDTFEVENITINNRILEKYDIENLELIPLLFQTGYLTIKSIDAMTGDMVLDYPNKEVRESMYEFLIDDIAKNPNRFHTGRTIKDLNQAFLSRDLPQVKTILNAILADLPSETYKKQSEGLYHGLLHIIFSYLGMFINSEVHSSHGTSRNNREGRADAVVQTLTDIYIFEFKFNKTAEEALTQIKNTKYADKYRALNQYLRYKYK